MREVRQVRGHQVMLTHPSNDRFLHLPPLVPNPLDDPDRDGRDTSGNQDEEGGIDVRESGAVESGR